MVLAARRRATPEAMADALAIAGLPSEWLDENPVIDPQSASLSEDVLARLRLARALCHGPRVLIIDDPWLAEDDALMARIRSFCRNQHVSLIEIVGQTPSALRAVS